MRINQAKCRKQHFAFLFENLWHNETGSRTAFGMYLFLEFEFYKYCVLVMHANMRAEHI